MPAESSREHCQLCPRSCGAVRADGESGECGVGEPVHLAAATIHRGEEPPISGTHGSATFFLAGCPLACVYCQNFPISQLGHGAPTTVERLARRMLVLARRGAHNINFVTATQFAPQIVEAVAVARRAGLAVPIVWNTSGYERAETIDLLAGTVDVYLTDIKYADDAVALRLSNAPGYFAIATAAARRMIAQVGPLELDAAGLARRGVIIRHLVLPGGLSQTPEVLRYVVREIGTAIPVSLMGQYFPAHRAREHPPLDRRLRRAEYRAAIRAARDLGIEHGWYQELSDDHRAAC